MNKVAADSSSYSKENFTIFQLTARLKFLGLTFNKKGSALAFWHLGNSSCELVINEFDAELSGKLGNMRVNRNFHLTRHHIIFLSDAVIRKKR